MKLSKIMRWILAGITSIAVFVAEAFVAVNMRWDNQTMLVVCVIVAVLSGGMVAPLQVLNEKRFVIFMAVLFILSCIFPPWQYTTDRDGYHSRKPAGYSLLLDPPRNPDLYSGSGVQLDFGRLFLEWAALAAVTGMGWLFVVKRPTTPPATGNPKN